MKPPGSGNGANTGHLLPHTTSPQGALGSENSSRLSCKWLQLPILKSLRKMKVVVLNHRSTGLLTGLEFHEKGEP